MSHAEYQNSVHFFFRVGMWWRLVYGVAKALLGLSLLHVIGTQSAALFEILMRHEIAEDPGDLVMRIIHPLVSHTSFEITSFVAIYLIFWGILEVFLSINLLRERLWAFQTALILIGAFVLFEIVRVSHTHSLMLFGIIVIDIVILWLIRAEQKARLARPSSPI